VPAFAGLEWAKKSFGNARFSERKRWGRWGESRPSDLMVFLTAFSSFIA